MSHRRCLLLVALLIAGATAQCLPNYSYFDNPLNDEDGPSCLRLFSGASIATPVTAKATCSSEGLGGHVRGHLLTFASVSTDARSVKGWLRSAFASAALAPNTQVLMGGQQPTGAVTTTSVGPKGGSWSWSDSTPASSIGSSWAPSQPDDGTAYAFDTHTEDYLALDSTLLQLTDVASNQRRPFVCEYSPPNPCPRGYRLFRNATGSEDVESCILVSTASYTYAGAVNFCRKNGALPFNHLLTVQANKDPVRIDVAENPTPLTQYLYSFISTNYPSVAGGFFWTDALFTQYGWTWSDSSAFTWGFGGSTAPVDPANVRGVLRLGPGAYTFKAVNPNSMWPAICEMDVTTQVVPLNPPITQSSVSGTILAMVAASGARSWKPLCNRNFNDSVARVACRQAGYTRGSLLDVVPETSSASVLDRFVLSGCGGTEVSLNSCTPSPDKGTTLSCDRPETIAVYCSNAASDSALYDVVTVPSDDGTQTRNVAITVAVVVIGAVVLALGVAYAVRGTLHYRRRRRLSQGSDALARHKGQVAPLPTTPSTSSREAAKGMASAPTIVIEAPEPRHAHPHHHHHHSHAHALGHKEESHQGLHHGLVLPPLQGPHGTALLHPSGPSSGTLRRPSREEAEQVQRQLLAAGPATVGPAAPEALVPTKEHAVLHPEHTVTVTAPPVVPTPDGPLDVVVVPGVVAPTSSQGFEEAEAGQEDLRGPAAL